MASYLAVLTFAKRALAAPKSTRSNTPSAAQRTERQSTYPQTAQSQAAPSSCQPALQASHGN
ncbi:hypothetical protein ACEU0B_001412 [Stenotrophomonas indicatrix]|uniref:hypothetical protein n=1 Tax=Stenotrophomonas indicatrix TaxID=2045451 RepID=UPI003733B70A